MSGRTAMISDTFAILLLLQTIPEAAKAMDTVIKENENVDRLAKSFADDCNSLYEGIPEVCETTAKARTIRDFLPKMRRQWR